MLGFTFYMMEVENTLTLKELSPESWKNLNKDPVPVFGGNVQTPDRG